MTEVNDKIMVFETVKEINVGMTRDIDDYESAGQQVLRCMYGQERKKHEVRLGREPDANCVTWI